MNPEETSFDEYVTKRKYALQKFFVSSSLDFIFNTHLIRSDSMSLIYYPDARAIALRGVIDRKH